MARRDVEEKLNDLLIERYNEKERMIGAENLRQAESIIMLNVVDNQWKDNLLSMDHLKEGIGLRGYGQKDPLIEYKKESYTMFQEMMDRIEDETIKYLYFMRIESGNVPLPYPEPEEEEFEDEAESDGAGAPNLEQQRQAQQSVLDLTRNIQRKKDKELAELQFTGGNGNGNQAPQACERSKSGPQRAVPLRQWKEVQEMPRRRSLTLALLLFAATAFRRGSAALARIRPAAHANQPARRASRHQLRNEGCHRRVGRLGMAPHPGRPLL